MNEPDPGAPQPVRLAAGIAIVQSLAAIAFGIFLIVRTAEGAENASMVFDASTPAWVGVGTAVFIFICFGFVIAGSWAMVKGAKWGRGAIVLLQFILAASSFQMMSGGALALGLVTLVSAIVTIALLMFIPASVQWAASHF